MNASTLILPFASAALGAAAALTLLGPDSAPKTESPVWNVEQANYRPAASPMPVAPPASAPNPSAAVPAVDFRGAAAAALDAVVHIRTEQRVSAAPQGWSSFFAPAPRSGVQRGSGSGVILSEAGYIVTNHHVIDGADAIEVGLNDNRSVPAELVGSDPATDIAVLRIEAGDLTALDWGDSDALQIGDWVLAVGNPFDLTSTVTAGIVSAKARDIQLLRPDYERDVFPVESFIQTDAAVNPGNSGGALVDTQGKLMGINTAIASRTGSYAGYAFAVPANLARKVADDLIEFGRVQRAYLGVNIRPVNESLAAELGLPEVEGVVVVGTTPGSGAEAAGLREGDVILRVGGGTTSTLPALLEKVNQYRPGQSADVEVWRDGQRTTFEVELRDRNGGTTAIRETPDDTLEILGAHVQAAENGTGVLVVKAGNGALARSDIPDGTRITALDGEPMNSPDDLLDAVEAAITEGRKAVLIEGVLQDGRQTWFGLGLR